MEAFIGTIILFAGNFAPRGWAFCQGQLLSINQNQALFSILGTTYGGDGRTTFALPDLRGRVPIGPGQGLGLSNHVLGERAGVESVTLTQTEMPTHSHWLGATTANGTTNKPEGAVLSVAQVEVERGVPRDGKIYSTESTNVVMSQTAIQTTGGSQPHTNMQPYLGLNYIICLQGIFPPRD